MCIGIPKAYTAFKNEMITLKGPGENTAITSFTAGVQRVLWQSVADNPDQVNAAYKLVMCSVSTNGERASLVNLKLTIGSLLECS